MLPEAGVESALLPLANASIEVLAPAGGRTAPARDGTELGPGGRALAEWLAGEGEGVFALGLRTDGASAEVEALRARGLAVSEAFEGRAEPRGEGTLRRWRAALLSLEAARGIRLFAVEPLEPRAQPPPPEAGAPAVSALDHAVVATSDPDASARLYGDALGLRLALDQRFEGRGVRLLFFRTGGVTLELVARLDAAPDPAAPDRFFGLAYRVGDAAAARERLAAAGLDVSEVRPGHKPGTRVCTVRSGTGGVPTLLIEPAPRVRR